jgi:hypothetical protein
VRRACCIAAAAFYCGCTFDVSGLPIGAPPDLAGADASDLASGGDLSTMNDLSGGMQPDLLDAAVGCAHVLCEDFESGTLIARWSKLESHGSVTVENTLAHGGSFALRAHANAVTPNNSISAHIAETESFPTLQAGLYARAFVYLPSSSGAPATPAIVFEMYQNSPMEGDQLDLDGTTGAFMYYQYLSNPEISVTSATALPLDRWVCLEWEMLSGETRTYLDGTELTDLYRAGNDVLAFDHFNLGYDFFKSANQPAYDLYIDDFALDTTRIGCN